MIVPSKHPKLTHFYHPVKFLQKCQQKARPAVGRITSGVEGSFHLSPGHYVIQSKGKARCYATKPVPPDFAKVLFERALGLSTSHQHTDQQAEAEGHADGLV